MSYDACSEGKLLRDAIDDYRERFGLLPKRMLAEQVYTTRENRAIYKALGIELSGKPLGRPSKNALPYDPGAGERNEVEGKFGTLKTCSKSGLLGECSQTHSTNSDLSCLLGPLRGLLL